MKLQQRYKNVQQELHLLLKEMDQKVLEMQTLNASSSDIRKVVGQYDILDSLTKGYFTNQDSSSTPLEATCIVGDKYQLQQAKITGVSSEIIIRVGDKIKWYNNSLRRFREGTVESCDDRAIVGRTDKGVGFKINAPFEGRSLEVLELE